MRAEAIEMPGRAELGRASDKLRTQMRARLYNKLTLALWRLVLLDTAVQYALDSPAGLRRR